MNLQLSHCYIFVGLCTRNKVYIRPIVTYDDTEFWISVDVLMPIRMTLNDLE